jgi:hypothetical protein
LHIYAAPLPAGSIQRALHGILDFIQMPGFHGAIPVLALTHSSLIVLTASRRNI